MSRIRRVLGVTALDPGGSPRVPLGPAESRWVLLGSRNRGSAGSRRVPPGPTGSCWVLLGLAGPCWVLVIEVVLGPDGPSR